MEKQNLLPKLDFFLESVFSLCTCDVSSLHGKGLGDFRSSRCLMHGAAVPFALRILMTLRVPARLHAATVNRIAAGGWKILGAVGAVAI